MDVLNIFNFHLINKLRFRNIALSVYNSAWNVKNVPGFQNVELLSQ